MNWYYKNEVTHQIWNEPKSKKPFKTQDMDNIIATDLYIKWSKGYVQTKLTNLWSKSWVNQKKDRIFDTEEKQGLIVQVERLLEL
jgi:predicted transcriptional regulator